MLRALQELLPLVEGGSSVSAWMQLAVPVLLMMQQGEQLEQVAAVLGDQSTCMGKP